MLLTYAEEIYPGAAADYWEKYCKDLIANAKRPWTDEEYEKWADNQLKDDIFRDWSSKKKALFKELMIEGKKAEPDIWDSTLIFRTMIDVETIEKCKELIAQKEEYNVQEN